ncbi:MAG: hypothetical protein AB8F94_00295 [Saprospiraceae bacterium]
MKKILLVIILLCSYLITIHSQELGNANSVYSGKSTPKNIYAKSFEPQMQFNNNNVVTIKVRGIYNDNNVRRVAYFGLTQLGKDIDEVNELMDARIKNVEQEIKKLGTSVEFFADMISFIPIYEFETEKKLFNKRTYNEVPKGFELKKNIHIAFSDGNLMNQIMAICGENEIYDLIKVDYISKDVEGVHDALRKQANQVYAKMVKNHESILGMDFSHKRKQFNEGFNVAYPKYRYNSYTAYSSPQLNVKRKSVVTQVKKSPTMYYEPMQYLQEKFIINPEIMKPSLQVVYEMQVIIQLNDPIPPPEPQVQVQIKTEIKKEFYMVNPQGVVTKLPTN